VPHDWTLPNSAAVYGIRDWGAGCLNLRDDGDVAVGVDFAGGRVCIPLTDMVSGTNARAVDAGGAALLTPYWSPVCRSRSWIRSSSSSSSM